MTFEDIWGKDYPPEVVRSVCSAINHLRVEGIEFTRSKANPSWIAVDFPHFTSLIGSGGTEQKALETLITLEKCYNRFTSEVINLEWLNDLLQSFIGLPLTNAFLSKIKARIMEEEKMREQFGHPGLWKIAAQAYFGCSWREVMETHGYSI